MLRMLTRAAHALTRAAHAHSHALAHAHELGPRTCTCTCTWPCSCPHPCLAPQVQPMVFTSLPHHTLTAALLRWTAKPRARLYFPEVAHRLQGPPCHAGRLGLPFGVRAAEPSRPANPSHSRRTRLIPFGQSSTPRESLRGTICRGRPPFITSTSQRRRLCYTAWASGGDRTPGLANRV